MSNIVVTHAPAGLIHAEVVRSERISPHFVRVTLGGPDLARFEYRGFDQWFRLALPVDDGSGLDDMPSQFTMRGFLSYRLLPKTRRPVVRNYTVRQFRADALELDIDFVVHGTEGVAGPWAASVEPGAPVAFIDQGCGWKPTGTRSVIVVADESGLPAAIGILRDLDRTATGHAIIEVPDLADAQEVDAPEGMSVQWIARDHHSPIGQEALAATRSLAMEDDTYVFAVGESALATGVRRWAVSEKSLPKQNVTFCGYWKAPKAAR